MHSPCATHRGPRRSVYPSSLRRVDNAFVDRSNTRVVVHALTFEPVSLSFACNTPSAGFTRCHRRSFAPSCQGYSSMRSFRVGEVVESRAPVKIQYCSRKRNRHSCSKASGNPFCHSTGKPTSGSPLLPHLFPTLRIETESHAICSPPTTLVRIHGRANGFRVVFLC